MNVNSLSAFCLAAPLAGVWFSAGAAETPLPPQCRDTLYARTTNFFSETVLLKPAEPDPAGPLFPLAPLILQELAPDHHRTLGADRFGTLSLSNNIVQCDSTRPAVYAAVDSVELAPGSSHPRFTYLWCYPGQPKRPGARPLPLPLQGIRLVLDAAGQPALWQVLADATGAQLLFVSQSLEAAAAARYGRPLEGRRFSIERSLEETPNVVVARVLEDGPVPMGPIVYLPAGSRDVSTVICRCMPAQARRVAEARTYELLPFWGNEAALAAARQPGRTTFWPGEPETRLAELLRLP